MLTTKPSKESCPDPDFICESCPKINQDRLVKLYGSEKKWSSSYMGSKYGSEKKWSSYYMVSKKLFNPTV